MKCTTQLILIIVVACSLFAGPSGAQTPATQPSTPAAQAFEKFKSLAGTWEGKSTKGWTEVLKIRVIAGGSVVIEESEFAHGQDPQNAMVTMYHLDGDRLILTHYCIAKNQPRLKATEISDDASKLTFEFIDGTGMKSRDTGHMDKVKVNFGDADNFSSQWTFYAKGKEQWMEEMTFKRTAPAPTTQPKPATGG